jgi:hypothetical protein
MRAESRARTFHMSLGWVARTYSLWNGNIRWSPCLTQGLSDSSWSNSRFSRNF